MDEILVVAKFLTVWWVPKHIRARKLSLYWSAYDWNMPNELIMEMHKIREYLGSPLSADDLNLNVFSKWEGWEILKGVVIILNFLVVDLQNHTGFGFH